MSIATVDIPVSQRTKDDKEHYEVVDGQRVETPRMGSYESDIANELAFWVNDLVKKTKGMGRAVVEILFRIDVSKNLQRRPDVAYISYDRWPKARRPQPNDAWNVVPDIAVEVVSENNTANEIQAKIQDYFRCGVRLVWVVYPMQEQVYVYSSPTKVAVLEKADELDGGDVIPGFRLPLSTLFITESE